MEEQKNMQKHKKIGKSALFWLLKLAKKNQKQCF